MKVLLVGDSHTAGSYGENLMALLKASASVTRLAAVGATAADFLPGGKYYAEARGTFNTPHDIAIITLGTNDAVGVDGPISGGVAAGRIKALADSIKATKVLWVGPPAFSDNAAKTYNPVFSKMDLNTRVNFLWQAASPVLRSFDSRPVTRPYVRENDIHFGPEGGKQWARAVVLGPVVDIIASLPGEATPPGPTPSGGGTASGDDTTPPPSGGNESEPPPINDSSDKSSKSKLFLYLGIGAVLFAVLMRRK